jgi:hypothetical protein
VDFRFRNIPVADYYLVAATDRDGDSTIGESEDVRGAYRTWTERWRVRVRSGDVVTGLDFSVARGSGATTTSEAPALALEGPPVPLSASVE